MITNNETTMYNLIKVVNDNNIYGIIVATMIGIVAIKLVEEKIVNVHLLRRKWDNGLTYVLDFSLSVFLSTFMSIVSVLVVLWLFLFIEKIILTVV